MKKYIILAILLSNIYFSTSAQHVCNWSFQYDFSVKCSGPGISLYEFDSLEIFINCPFYSTGLDNCYLKYNDNTSEYSIFLNYHGVCNFKGFKTPPEIIIQIHMFDKFENENFSIMMPITSDTISKPETLVEPLAPGENPENPIVHFDLGPVNFYDIIYFKEKYSGIRILNDGSNVLYTKDAYPFPEIKKLIPVQLTKPKLH